MGMEIDAIANPLLRPIDDIDGAEWARYAKAKRTTDLAKLRAMLPPYIKTWLASHEPPKPFKPDLRQVLPRIETGAQFRARDPRSTVKPGKGTMRYVDGTTRGY